MFLKIIAMGLVLQPFSYLRDPWNVLDCLIVIGGWVGLILSDLNNGSKYTAIRIVRILRPLRTINSMPGMAGLVATILSSLPVMVDVLILFLFVLMMFGAMTT